MSGHNIVECLNAMNINVIAGTADDILAVLPADHGKQKIVLLSLPDEKDACPKGSFAGAPNEKEEVIFQMICRMNADLVGIVR